MGSNILLFTTYELFLSFVFGLLSLYLGQKFLLSVILKCSLDEVLEKKSWSLALFSGSLIFCILLLTRTSILPSVSFLQIKASGTAGVSFSFLLTAFLYFLFFFVISFSSTVLMLFISSKIVVAATKDIDEIQAIKEGNTAIAVFLSLIMISFSLYVRPSLEHLLGAIIHLVTT